MGQDVCAGVERASSNVNVRLLHPSLSGSGIPEQLTKEREECLKADVIDLSLAAMNIELSKFNDLTMK